MDTSSSWNDPHWTLTLAQPQRDKADTAVFQNIDDLLLPSSLQNLCVELDGLGVAMRDGSSFDADCGVLLYYPRTIVGATASSQVIVPLSFSSNAFRSGTSLQQMFVCLRR